MNSTVVDLGAAAIKKIVERLVREGHIPDSPEWRVLAEETAREVVRRRVILTVRSMFGRWFGSSRVA